MSDADCTPGREPRSVAASSFAVIEVQCYSWFDGVTRPLKIGYLPRGSVLDRPLSLS